MAVTPLGWAAVNTPDALGTVFNSLASGAAATTAAIDNTETTVGSAAFEQGDLWLVMSAAITTGTGSPFLVATVLESLDGTNYEPALVSGTTLYPIERSSTKPLDPSTAYTVLRIPLLIPPSLFKVALLNNSGVAFAATVTASLYRKRGQAG